MTSSLRRWPVASVVTLAIAGLAFAACRDEPTRPPTTNAAPAATPLGAVVGGPVAGAIFTTTPNGGIVNENVRYNAKIEVYLDGGPGPHAPATAAGLTSGDYVFQITDPSGAVLLSEDPALCRQVRVSGGVITQYLSQGLTYQSGGTKACDVQNATDGVAGPAGKHDVNHDVDHWSDAGAIVVQMMPFYDTPNPGGVYKAWMTPLSSYLGKGGSLAALPQDQKVRGKKVGYLPDPGFGVPRAPAKTDNFKVKEVPPRIIIDKYNDLNGNGALDAGEPLISGWPVHVTETLGDNSTITNDYYTEASVAVAPNTSPLVCEDVLNNWAFKFALVDGSPVSATLQGGQECVTVPIGSTNVTVAFGNFELASKSGTKFHDLNADGTQGAGEGALSGWRIELLKYDGSAYVFQTFATTAATTGAYSFGGLDVGTYAVCEVAQANWYQSAPASAPAGETLVNCAGIDAKYSGNGFGFVVNTSGQALTGNAFGNYTTGTKSGTKYLDVLGDGIYKSALGGVTIELWGTDPNGPVAVKTQVTDATTGAYSFSGLLPGSYVVCEVVGSYVETAPVSGAAGTTDCSQYDVAHGHKHGAVGYAFTLQSQQVHAANDFCNTTPCAGLSPGYWTNWNNHYTSTQFLQLLQTTIAAGNISLANQYLTSTGCDDGDAISCMRRMLLADQLTVRLTTLNAGGAALPNPSGGDLKLACSAVGVTGNLSTVFANALAIHNANGVGYTRDQILAAKNALAAFITK